MIDNGKVLAVQNDRDRYYYPLSGAIQHGESAEEAVIREIFEETGIEFEVDHLVFVHENLFIGNTNSILEGLRCHEVTFYFLMNWIPGTRLSGNSITCGGLLEHSVWLEISKLNKLDRQFFPEFFGEELKNMSGGVKHIVAVSEQF